MNQFNINRISIYLLIVRTIWSNNSSHIFNLKVPILYFHLLSLSCEEPRETIDIATIFFYQPDSFIHPPSYLPFREMTYYFILFLFYLYILSKISEIDINIIRSGDIETNPGPEAAATNVCTKQLSFCHMNVRSMLQQSDVGSRFNYLYNYVCRDNCYDVVALTETHFSQDVDDSEI